MNKVKKFTIYALSAILGLVVAGMAFNAVVGVEPNQEEFKALKSAHSELLKVEREISKLKVAEEILEAELGAANEAKNLTTSELIELSKTHQGLIDQVNAIVGFQNDREVTKIETPQHKCWLTSDPENKVVNTAWELSQDLNFIALLHAENGKFTIDRVSDLVGSNGYRDVGYCQINIGFHPEIYYDKRFKTDMKWQLEQCLKLYTGGTKFYGNIENSKKHFTCE